MYKFNQLFYKIISILSKPEFDMVDVVGLCKRLKYETISHTKDFFNSLKTLEDDNISAAYNFIDSGLLFDAKVRLKTIVALWPKNHKARYLLILVYILDEKIESAKKNLEELLKTEKDFKRGDKLEFFLKNGNFAEAKRVYYQDYSIESLEKYIEEFSK